MDNKFRCVSCQKEYPGNAPAIEFLMKGICPSCGKEVIALEDQNKKKKWHEPAFTQFPSVIAYEYERLRYYSEKKDVYGTFIQLKDTIEVTIKFAVLVACAWGNEHRDALPEAIQKYEKLLSKQLSLGEWHEILVKIRGYYDHLKKESGRCPVPMELYKLVDKTAYWAKHGRKEENIDLPKWRNDKYGHGAMRKEDDNEFLQDLEDKITYITEFYRQNEKIYNAIVLSENGMPLAGYKLARDLRDETGDCKVSIGNCKSVSMSPYILHKHHGIYFYDSLVRACNSKLLNYPTGDSKLVLLPHFRDMLNSLSDNERIKDRSINASFVSRQEYNYIARMGVSKQFVEPKAIVDWLNGCVGTNSKGVFLLEMERGCGKTCFSEKLNGRFQDPIYIQDGNVDVRTIHLSKTQTGGVNRFLKDLQNEWLLAYFDKDIFLESITMPVPDECLENNAIALANFLNRWRVETENARMKEKIMLVIDGLDEITEENCIIWSYIPSAEMLDDGVYLLLTSRIPEREDVPAKLAKNISALNLEDQNQLIVGLEDKENLETLHAFVRENIPVDEQTGDKLIEKAGYRILSLNMLSLLWAYNAINEMSIIESSEITGLYLQNVEGKYNETRIAQLHGLLILLASLGEYESLSLREIADLLMMDEIKLDLLDMITDLMPLLNVERGFLLDGTRIIDANRYHFANGDVAKKAIEHVGLGYVRDYLRGLFLQVRFEINNIDYPGDYSEGVFCLLSHMEEVIQEFGLDITWAVTDVVEAVKYNPNDVRIDERIVSLEQMRMICLYESMLNILSLFPPADLARIENTYMLVANSLIDHYLNVSMFGKAINILKQMHGYYSAVYGRSSAEAIGVAYRVATIQIDKNDVHDAELAIAKMESICKTIDGYKETVMWAQVLLLKAKIPHLNYAVTEREITVIIDQYLNSAIRILDDKEKTLETELLKAEVCYLRALYERETKKTEASEIHFRLNVARARENEKEYPGHFTEWIAHNLTSWGGVYKKDRNIVALRESERLRLEAYGYLHELYEKRGKCIRDYALCCNTLGNIYRSLGEYEQGKRFHQESMLLREKMYKRDPKAYVMDLAHSYHNYAHLLNDIGLPGEAIRYYAKSIALFNTVEEKHKRLVVGHLVKVYILQFDSFYKLRDRFSAINNLFEISRIAPSVINISIPDSKAYSSFLRKLKLPGSGKAGVVEELLKRMKDFNLSDIRGNSFSKFLGLALFADYKEKFVQEDALVLLGEIYKRIAEIYMRYRISDCTGDIYDCFMKLAKSTGFVEYDEDEDLVPIKKLQNPVVEKKEASGLSKNKGVSASRIYSLDEAIDITLAIMSKEKINEILKFMDGPKIDLHGGYRAMLFMRQIAGLPFYIDEFGIIHEEERPMNQE